MPRLHTIIGVHLVYVLFLSLKEAALPCLAIQEQVLLQGLADGSCQIAIGTHALLTDEVLFADLALAVVDEQHRFGVRQRLVLGQKGKNCDVLVMTATPIPRTLAMTAYGDLTVSRLDEKPAGRQDIETALISEDRLVDVTALASRSPSLFFAMHLQSVSPRDSHIYSQTSTD